MTNQLLELIRDLTDALQQSHDMLEQSFCYDGDVFGVHHNDAMDAVTDANVMINRAKEVLKSFVSTARIKALEDAIIVCKQLDNDDNSQEYRAGVTWCVERIKSLKGIQND